MRGFGKISLHLRWIWLSPTYYPFFTRASPRFHRWGPYFAAARASAALAFSVGVTLAALFVFGFVKGYFTGARPVRSAAQTVLIGGIAAAAARFGAAPTSIAYKEGVDMERIRIEQHTFAGGLWFVGWLFTIGFLHLHFWRGVLAIVVWPYYLGVTLSALLPH